MEYLKQVFYPKSLEHAKDICLTPDGRVPQKFTKETMFLLDFILKENLANNYSKVADFGCGVGRMSKALIQRHEQLFETIGRITGTTPGGK